MKTITICASVDFSPKIIELKKEFETMGFAVNIPFFTERILEGTLSYEELSGIKKVGGDIEVRKRYDVDMIKRYWDFIKNSDAILVLNLEKKGIKNYIGGSTLMEMGFAYGHGKKIFLYNDFPEASERIHYLDEIIDLDPIVIHGDLEKLEKELENA